MSMFVCPSCTGPTDRIDYLDNEGGMKAHTVHNGELDAETGVFKCANCGFVFGVPKQTINEPKKRGRK